MNKDPHHIKFDKDQFKIPEGYFDDLRESIKTSTQFNIQEDSFLVPTDYFESFGEVLKSKINPPVIPIQNQKWMKYSSYAVAAGLALFLLLRYFPAQEKCENFTCMLENTELVEDDINWIEQEIIEDYYSEIIEDEITQDDNALIEYILENDWDVEYLIEQE